MLVLALTCALVLLSPARTWALTSGEVRDEAAAEAARLDELSARLGAARAEVDELGRQMDELADQSVALQGALIEDRARLAELVARSYRAGGDPSLIDVVLASTSLEDLLSNLYYTQKVIDWQTTCIEQVREDHRALDARMEAIGRTRQEREAAVGELQDACDAASAAVAELSVRASELEQEERAAEEERLAELARQAEEERARLEEESARQRARSEVAAVEESDQQPVSAAEPEPEPTEELAETQAEKPGQAAAEEPEPAEAPAEPGDADAGWITCVASAYTIADNTPPGSTATASGIPLDESVPTVAMPLSIGPERFFGQRIQIEYGAMTVVATVTDSGGMGGGSRGLDLTPAVFRAFGATSADDWGLRTVRYRFL